jgi:hypothetical protein
MRNPPATSARQKITRRWPATAASGTQFNWDLASSWDTPVVNSADVSLDGTENNIGFLFYSNRAQDDPHTVLQGVNLLYTPRRLVHSGT